MNKKYFGYLLKSRKAALIFFFVLYLGICLTPLVNADSAEKASTFSFTLDVAFVMSTMMTFILPVMMFAFVHRRRSADVYFALPVSRTEHLVTNMVFMFAMAFGYFLVSTLILFIISAGSVSFAKYLVCAGWTAVVILELLVIHTSIYLFANNIFDGIIMIAAYLFIPLLLYICGNIFVDNMIIGLNSYMFSGRIAASVSPVAAGFMVFEGLSDKIYTAGSFPGLRFVLEPLLITVAAGYLLIRNMVNRKSERAEQLSDEFTAYPLIIHLYAFTILIGLASVVFNNGFPDYVILYLLLTFCYFVATFVYRRKVSVSLKDIGIYAGMIALSLMFAAGCWYTKGFGLAKNYRLDEGKYLRYEYSATVHKEDLGIPAGYVIENRNAYEDNGVNNYVHVNFGLEIPVDKMDEYREAVNVMENNRQDNIDYLYAHRSNRWHGGWLSVCNISRWNGDYYEGVTNRFNYSTVLILSEADLNVIDRYANVTVYDEFRGAEQPLEEYLQKRGK